MSGEIDFVWARPKTSPIINEPNAFAAKVPQGKPFPSCRYNQEPGR